MVAAGAGAGAGAVVAAGAGAVVAAGAGAGAGAVTSSSTLAFRSKFRTTFIVLKITSSPRCPHQQSLFFIYVSMKDH